MPLLVSFSYSTSPVGRLLRAVACSGLDSSRGRRFAEGRGDGWRQPGEVSSITLMLVWGPVTTSTLPFILQGISRQMLVISIPTSKLVDLVDSFFNEGSRTDHPVLQAAPSLSPGEPGPSLRIWSLQPLNLRREVITGKSGSGWIAGEAPLSLYWKETHFFLMTSTCGFTTAG